MKTLKFRAWSEGQMISPDYISRDGFAYWKENSIPQCSNNIMQFTGLKDKNGKEIYEGDVVKHDFETDYGPQEHRDIVEYLGGAFYPICEKPENEFEVIGNIYQNPELLK